MNTGVGNPEAFGERRYEHASGLSKWYSRAEAANERRRDDGGESMRIDLDSMTEEQYEQYRVLCNSRNSAEYRFRREACCIEIAEIAEELDVRLDTAKRWENPKKGPAPSLRAWAYVDSAYLDLLESVEKVVRTLEEAGDDPEPVKIAYRRFNPRVGDSYAVTHDNAVSRAVAIALDVLGYDYEFEWSVK